MRSENFFSGRLILIVIIIIFTLILFPLITMRKYAVELVAYSVIGCDHAILVEWENPVVSDYLGVRLTITDESGKFCKVVENEKQQESYLFEEGEHGKLYHFKAEVMLKNGHVSEGVSALQ